MLSSEAIEDFEGDRFGRSESTPIGRDTYRGEWVRHLTPDNMPDILNYSTRMHRGHEKI